jgi:hypothetical protein
MLAVGGGSGAAGGLAQRLVASGGKSAGTLSDVVVDASIGAATAGVLRGASVALRNGSARPPVASGRVLGSEAAFRRQYGELGRAGPAAMGPAGEASRQLNVTFGRNANQVHHAFRHTDQLGLSRTAVQDVVRAHLPTVIDKIPIGRPLNQVIEVSGQRVQYSAFRLPDGSINVGRIHGVP